jgi:hypothetical protein
VNTYANAKSAEKRQERTLRNSKQQQAVKAANHQKIPQLEVLHRRIKP